MHNQVLKTVRASGVISFIPEGYITLYEDGTYRYSMWEEDRVAFWKVDEHGNFWVRHTNRKNISEGWIKCSSKEDKALKQILKMFDDELVEGMLLRD